MKLLSLAITALAVLPSALSSLGAPTHELSNRHLNLELDLAKRGTCTMRQRAACYRKSMAMDPNTCRCTTLPTHLPGPKQPWGALFYAACTDVDKIAACWENGDNVDAFCHCFRGNGRQSENQPPPPPRCEDWLKVAECHLSGMKADTGCNCVSGVQDIPGGMTQCTNALALSECWANGHAVDPECKCITPLNARHWGGWDLWGNKGNQGSRDICINYFAIIGCNILGFDVRTDCSCEPCSRALHSQCSSAGGVLSSQCRCTTPSRRALSVGKRAELHCSTGETRCPIPHRGGKDTYECVDTRSDIESCGGCVFGGEGEDCTSIEGAAAVSCVEGKCVVSRWIRGSRRGYTHLAQPRMG